MYNLSTPRMDAILASRDAGAKRTVRSECVAAVNNIVNGYETAGLKMGARKGHVLDQSAQFLVDNLSGNSKFGFTKSMVRLTDGTYGLAGPRYEKLLERTVRRVEANIDLIPETEIAD